MKYLQAVALGLLLCVLSAAQAAAISWHTWQDETFELARKTNRLILLDVGTEWCSACNKMQHQTYTDSGVQQLLSEHFIALHVDAEAQPDLGERYGFWGWPALIFIAPDGRHVGFFRGFRSPEVFSRILTSLQQAHHSGQLEAPAIEVELLSTPAADDFSALVKRANGMLDRFYDSEHHGWGGSRMANPYLLQQAWWRGVNPQQQRWNERAHKTSQQYRRMIDPVWGGIWFGSRDPDYAADYIHERRSEHQAGALAIFSQAYQHQPDPQWLQAIERIWSYLEHFMLSDSGDYFTSQEMHIIAQHADITPRNYFELDDSARRAIGMPAIDKTRYSDINAKLVIAFADVYKATADPRWRSRALSLMQRLQDSSDGNGGYPQLIRFQADDERIRQLRSSDKNQRFLRTQAFAGLAALACFEISGNSAFLREAHAIGELIINRLREPDSGGLLASYPVTRGPDGSPIRDQPLTDSGAAADFFNRLAGFSYGAFDDIGAFNSRHYRAFSESALRAVADPERLRVQGYFIAHYLLALHQWQDEFIQVSVVCEDMASSACQQLHTTALTRLHHPRRLVKLQTPGYYPAPGAATLFICNSSLCSSPIASDDEALIEKVSDWYQTLIKR